MPTAAPRDPSGGVTDWTRETLSASDGYPLVFDRFAPIGPRRGTVVFLHGIQSHSGWYVGTCRFLAARGFEVRFFNRRGSGPCERDRGHATGWRQLAADIRLEVERTVADSDDPVFVAAISWGGKLLLAAESLGELPIAGRILLCPGWFAKVRPNLREQLAIGWSFLLWPRRMIPIPLSDPALFTDDPGWREYLRTDPLALRLGSARLLMTSRILDGVIGSAAAKLTRPSLLMLAGRDRIIANEPTRALFERFTARDRTVLDYPHAAHTLEFEPDADSIRGDLARWIEERL